VGGRVEGLISHGRVQRVARDDVSIKRLLDDAARHLRTTGKAKADGDLSGAYQLAYDAARKSLTALALARGLRVKGEGAHANLITVVQEEFAGEDGIGDVSKLDRLRRKRHKAEYDGYWFEEEEVSKDLQIFEAIVELAARVLGNP